MDAVLSKLRELREYTIIKLKQGDKEALKEKLELDRAIECLEFCKKYNLFANLKEHYKVFELPIPSESGYFSEYRIIDDCETENREYWKEILVSGKSLFLSPGDILIKK